MMRVTRGYDIADVRDAAMMEDRRRLFVDTMGWQIRVVEGRFEIDQFDGEAAVYIADMDEAGCHRGSMRLLRRPGCIPDLLAAIEHKGLSTEWDGEPFAADQLPSGEPLRLMAHEVAWGRFEELEAFCIANGLPFARWSGAYDGQWGTERVVFDGSGEAVSYAADEDDYILVGRETVERLGSIAAVLAHFDAADFALPPLVLAGWS